MNTKSLLCILSLFLTTFAFSQGISLTTQPAKSKTETLPPAQQALTEKLKSITIEHAQFQETELQQVLPFFAEKIKKLDPKKEGVNLVLANQPSFDAKKVVITLELKNVSAYDALKYTAQAAGLRMQVDENAIVFTPSAIKF